MGSSDDNIEKRPPNNDSEALLDKAQLLAPKDVNDLGRVAPDVNEHGASGAEGPDTDGGLLDTVAQADDQRTSLALPSTSARTSFQPGKFIRQYQLIRELGQGGMGTVYLARDTRLGRLVAVKFMSSHDSHLSERFKVEARATARVNHENIVVIHEVGDHQGYPYMVLEYLSGKTLKQWLDERALEADPRGERSPLAERPPVPVTRILEFMIPVVRALVKAHARGIVHRDLKPANIMITDAGIIKVLDFGLAKHRTPDKGADITGTFLPARVGQPVHGLEEDAQLTRTGAFMGTTAYMSPEQWGADEVDHRSDLWAVGIMLFEMVAGYHPLAPVSLERLRTVADLDEAIPVSACDIPSAGPLGPIIDRCLIKRRRDRIEGARLLLNELESLRASGRALGHGDRERNPFAGLAAFQKSDADRFFGREREVEAVIQRLRAQPLLALLAPSGAGKSSLVRAGILPALERSGEGWESYILRPGRRPLTTLGSLLAPVYSSYAPLVDNDGMREESGAPAPAATGETRKSDQNASHISAEGHPVADPDELVRGLELTASLRTEPGLLGTVLRNRAHRRRRRIAIFVDQFEELYTLCPDPDERAVFIACMEGVADDASSPLRVILAMRSDFFDRVAADRSFINTITRGLIFVPPIDRHGLRDALVRPLEESGYRFEDPAMVESMLDELGGSQGALPLLQFTASKLWDARDREQHLLTEASYREIGGVEGTLASHADSVLTALSGREQTLARRVLERLVTPERTRAVVSTSELEELSRDPAEILDIVESLASARLLTVETRGDDVAGDTRRIGTVELVHESLIERWPTLRRWLDESVEDRAFLTRLRAAAQQWDASGRAAGSLWRDEAVHEARRFQERYRGEIPTREAEYLDAVFALAERSARRRTAIIGTALAFLAVIASVTGYLAWSEAQASERAAVQAERANQEAARANLEAERANQSAKRARDASRTSVARELSHDPTTALALLREVAGREHAYGWKEQIRATLNRSIARHVLHWPGHDLRLVQPLPGDGFLVLTTDREGQARLFGLDGAIMPLARERYQHQMTQARLNPALDRLVTAGTDQFAYLWRVDRAGGRITFERVLTGHSDRIWNAHFSHDGTRILTVSGDATARVWSVDREAPPIVLRGHKGWILSGHFTPDDERVVTASYDRTVRVWRADGTGPVRVFSGHTERINELEIDPSGKRAVTASFDTTARIWDLDGDAEPIVLAGHEDWVMHATFSPDGSRVATASYDLTARVWTLPTNPGGALESVVLRGHEGFVTRVGFSDDGRWVLSASKDSTARVWSEDGRIGPWVLSHSGAVQGFSSQPDGGDVMTYASDGTVRVWAMPALRQRSIMLAPGGGQHGVFSPDGSRALVGFRDGELGLWDLTSAHWIDSIPPSGTAAHGVAFSPDGSLFAAGFGSGEARVWDAENRQLVVTLRGHEGAVHSVDFSPDGRSIVTASADRTTRIWSVDTGAEEVVLRGHDEWVTCARYSVDGSHVATSSLDKTIRVVRADGSGEPIVLRGHRERSWKVGYSPDGRRLASVSADGAIRVWRVDAGRPVGQPLVLEGHTDLAVGMDFSPDSQRIVSSSTDATIRIWRVDGSGEPMVLGGYDDQIESVTFSPDGRRILTTGQRHGAWVRSVPDDLSEEFLWSLSDYCPSPAMRQELLGVTDAAATEDFARCRQRVRAHGP